MGNAVRPLVDGEPAFRRICEAVESAEHSVWITVAFLERDVAMPDGRGTFFDVLDRAAVRGLDVRALFWREPRFDEFEPHSSHFPGDDAERRWLGERGSGLRARWDQLPDGFCQHQKSWIVDAGEATWVRAPVNLVTCPPGQRNTAPAESQPGRPVSPPPGWLPLPPKKRPARGVA